MAQQREKEDTSDLNLKVPETLSTLPSLSTCTQSIQLSPPHLPLPPSDESRPSIRLTDPSDPNPSPPNESSSTSSGSNPIFSPKKSTKRPRDKEVKRCSCNGCKKKLGLMGFRCRCGDMFCPEHRYSDRHDCSFDYKAAGKEAIAKENPVVRAAKLLKV